MLYANKYYIMRQGFYLPGIVDTGPDKNHIKRLFISAPDLLDFF